jgi:hypothetical protein
MQSMTVEIIPFTKQELALQITIPPAARVRLRPIPPNTIPEGCDATVTIDGEKYVIRDYRGRPTHEPGAKITGHGCTEELNEQHSITEINKNIFLYAHSHE